MVRNRATSNLERLPTDVQTEIISRVARHTRRSVRNLMAAIPPLAISAAVPIVYRNLNLHPLTFIHEPRSPGITVLWNTASLAVTSRLTTSVEYMNISRRTKEMWACNTYALQQKVLTTTLFIFTV